MSFLGRQVASTIARLERPGYPENGITSHFGVTVPHPSLRVEISPRGRGTLVIMYASHMYAKVFREGCQSDPFNGRIHLGYQQALHQARAISVAKALNCGILSFWNGEDGHNGISIILDYRCPESLCVAVTNYNKMQSPFKLRAEDEEGFAAFRKWFYHEDA